MSPARSDSLLGDGDFLSIDQALGPFKTYTVYMLQPIKNVPK